VAGLSLLSEVILAVMLTTMMTRNSNAAAETRVFLLGSCFAEKRFQSQQEMLRIFRSNFNCTVGENGVVLFAAGAIDEGVCTG
jgi:hypothetical protein